MKESTYFSPVDEQEIRSIIQSIKSKMSCGDDGISMHVVRTSINFLTLALVHIINLMLQTDCFPDNMRISLLKPLHKKVFRKIADNYRLITLL